MINTTIYFDWESGQWMTCDEYGNIKEWNGVSNDAVFPDDYPMLPSGTKSDMDSSTWGCMHEWAVYDSGIRRFMYCRKCNAEKAE
jgi:hypothetical protein